MTRLTPTLAAALVCCSLLPGTAARAEDRPTLELSLDDAVKRALDNNVDIAVEKYNPELSAQSVRQALGYYDPFLSSSLIKSSQDTPGTSAFSGGAKVTTDVSVWNLGVNQYLPTGAAFSLTFNNNKQDTTNTFTSFNPTYSSTLTASLTQPLLKNFRIDGVREQIKVAKKNREISDVQFRQTVINTVASVKKSYWDLIYAIDNLQAAQKSLALAKKLLSENEIRVRVGTMAPLDVVEAKSEVAFREGEVIVAESTVANAEDVLKSAIFPKNDPATWAIRILPTDRPSAEPMAVDAEAATKIALEKRTDVVAARKGLERADISVQYARNQTLPQLDLTASYGATGVGGTQLERQGFGGPVIGTIPGGYGDAVSSVFGRDFPTWTVRFNIAYPILNRQAAAASAQARVTKNQLVASFQRLELQVAAEVRSAARAVETNVKLVAATKAARVLSSDRLDAEEKKFAAGMSTNFLVTQAQRDLAVAEVAELQAIAAYRKSIIDFERVQESGITGSGSVAAVATAYSASSLPTSTATTTRTP